MAQDTPQWRSNLLQKIGGYGFSDPLLLTMAGAICAKRALTDEQRRYAGEFEARLGHEAHAAALRIQGFDDPERSGSKRCHAAPARGCAN